LLKELSETFFLLIDKLGFIWFLRRIGLQNVVTHLDHERDEVHVVLGATTMGVSRERVLVGESLHNHFQIMQDDLHSVGVAVARCFHLALEIAFDHGAVVVDAQISTSKGIQVVAL
jgi:hypothetical protein